MSRLLSLFYFVGLIMFGIAVGSHTNVAEYAFMIIGGGTTLYAMVMGIVIYLGGR